MAKDLAGRYARGRAYAIQGQVVGMNINGNTVEAQVQGARSDAYRVRLAFSKPEGATRERIVETLRARPAIVARLAARDMPLELEALFRDEHRCLFPGDRTPDGGYDVAISCTCPDYAAVCKHSFAVLLALGEEISSHPDLLLALRGIQLDELFSTIMQ